MDAMQISLSALDVEWRRYEQTVTNLALIPLSRPAGQTPYQAMRLVTGPQTAFGGLVGEGQRVPGGVAVLGLASAGAEPRRELDKANPHADADGYVLYSAVDHAAEMLQLMAAARAYEANIVAMNMGRQVYLKALDIGRRQ